MKINFTKMQGVGNDFIIINCLKGECTNDWESLSKKICRRHFGVGADGVILIMKSDKADFKMRLFNSDGSEAEIGGNGIRCLAKYVYDNKITKDKKIDIETLAGVIPIEITGFKDGLVEIVKVNMGEPVFEAECIPADAKGKIINRELNLENQSVNITCVSFGSPHCVLFLESFGVPIEKIGPEIENHKMFPEKTNVEFVQVVNESEINMQSWERGSGVTLACGTGASAAVVAGVLNKKTLRKVKVKLIEGELDIEWNEKDNHVYLEGIVENVFSGEYETE